MNSHFFWTRALADALPWSSQIGEICARPPAGDDSGIAFNARQLCQHGARFRSQQHPPPASLGIPQLNAIVLDVVPAERLDFRKPTARPEQRPESGDSRRHLGLDLAEDCAETLGLFLGGLPVSQERQVPVRLRNVLRVGARDSRRGTLGCGARQALSAVCRQCGRMPAGGLRRSRCLLRSTVIFRCCNCAAYSLSRWVVGSEPSFMARAWRRKCGE